MTASKVLQLTNIIYNYHYLKVDLHSALLIVSGNHFFFQSINLF